MNLFLQLDSVEIAPIRANLVLIHCQRHWDPKLHHAKRLVHLKRGRDKINKIYAAKSPKTHAHLTLTENTTENEKSKHPAEIE
jgi:hypothetical protein